MSTNALLNQIFAEVLASKAILATVQQQQVQFISQIEELRQELKNLGADVKDANDFADELNERLLSLEEQRKSHCQLNSDFIAQFQKKFREIEARHKKEDVENSGIRGRAQGILWLGGVILLLISNVFAWIWPEIKPEVQGWLKNIMK